MSAVSPPPGLGRSGGDLAGRGRRATGQRGKLVGSPEVRGCVRWDERGMRRDWEIGEEVDRVFCHMGSRARGTWFGVWRGIEEGGGLPDIRGMYGRMIPSSVVSGAEGMR